MVTKKTARAIDEAIELEEALLEKEMVRIIEKEESDNAPVNMVAQAATNALSNIEVLKEYILKQAGVPGESLIGGEFKSRYDNLKAAQNLINVLGLESTVQEK